MTASLMTAHHTTLEEKRTKQQHRGASAYYIRCKACAASDGSAHSKCQPEDLAISAALEQRNCQQVLWIVHRLCQSKGGQHLGRLATDLLRKQLMR